MSHTNSTTNYNLSQFVGSDKPAWLTDYNSDMQAIDAQMKLNADAAAANASDIDTIEGAIGAEGLAGRMTQAENDITSIDALLGDTQLPTTAQSVTGAIAELKGVNDTQNGAISDNAAEIIRVAGNIEGVAQVAYTIADVYDATETYAVGDYALYQGTLYKCTTAINVGEAFDPTKWTSVKVMDEIPSGGGGTSYTAGDGIDITGNTISVDATTRAAISANTEARTASTTAKIVGTDEDGDPIYEKVYVGTTLANDDVLDSALTVSAVKHFTISGCATKDANTILPIPFSIYIDPTRYIISAQIRTNGLVADISGYTVLSYRFVVRYSLVSNP